MLPRRYTPGRVTEQPQGLPIGLRYGAWVALLAATLGLAGAGEDASKAPAASRVPPRPFVGVGRLVDLNEEMRNRYGAKVSALSPRTWGFRLERPDPADQLRHYVLLLTPHSEALFSDKRFAEHTLRLNGRVFPGTALLEVSRFRWFEDGKLHDVYYWCEVCSIRGIDPGPCACCQAPVELRTAPTPPAKAR